MPFNGHTSHQWAKLKRWLLDHIDEVSDMTTEKIVERLNRKDDRGLRPLRFRVENESVAETISNLAHSGIDI